MSNPFKSFKRGEKGNKKRPFNPTQPLNPTQPPSPPLTPIKEEKGAYKLQTGNYSSLIIYHIQLNQYDSLHTRDLSY
jgi:hypothetical protein